MSAVQEAPLSLDCCAFHTMTMFADCFVPATVVLQIATALRIPLLSRSQALVDGWMDPLETPLMVCGGKGGSRGGKETLNILSKKEASQIMTKGVCPAFRENRERHKTGDEWVAGF